jgi:drug/metabolite transporter (DMT)-like permease
MVWSRMRGERTPSLLQWRNAAIIGTVMLGGNQGGVAIAEQTVASGVVVASMAMTPAFITIVSLAFGMRPTKLEVIGISVGFLGVLLLVHGAALTTSPVALVALTVAVLSWSSASVFSQHVYHLAPGFAGYASQMLCAGALLLTLSLCTGERIHWPPQANALAAWFYLVLFGSLIAFTSYMTLLSRTRPALAGSWTFVTPVVGMLVGSIAGNERTTGTEWLAVGIIVGGVTILIMGRERGLSVAASKGQIVRNKSA